MEAARSTLRRFADLLGLISTVVGKIGAMLLPVLMLVIVANVTLRYGFGIGMIELEEVQWHLNAFVVLACLAYAYRDDEHVRVDVLHARFSVRTRAWIELLGVLFLLLPFVVGIAWFAWSNFSYSWSIGERSAMPSGLPARYVVKFCLFAGFGVLGLQGVAVALRACLMLQSPDREPADDPVNKEQGVS